MTYNVKLKKSGLYRLKSTNEILFFFNNNTAIVVESDKREGYISTEWFDCTLSNVFDYIGEANLTVTPK